MSPISLWLCLSTLLAITCLCRVDTQMNTICTKWFESSDGISARVRSTHWRDLRLRVGAMPELRFVVEPTYFECLRLYQLRYNETSKSMFLDSLTNVNATEKMDALLREIRRILLYWFPAEDEFPKMSMGFRVRSRSSDAGRFDESEGKSTILIAFGPSSNARSCLLADTTARSISLLVNRRYLLRARLDHTYWHPSIMVAHRELLTESPLPKYTDLSFMLA